MTITTLWTHHKRVRVLIGFDIGVGRQKVLVNFQSTTSIALMAYIQEGVQVIQFKLHLPVFHFLFEQKHIMEGLQTSGQCLWLPIYDPLTASKLPQAEDARGKAPHP